MDVIQLPSRPSHNPCTSLFVTEYDPINILPSEHQVEEETNLFLFYSLAVSRLTNFPGTVWQLSLFPELDMYISNKLSFAFRTISSVDDNFSAASALFPATSVPP